MKKNRKRPISFPFSTDRFLCIRTSLMNVVLVKMCKLEIGSFVSVIEISRVQRIWTSIRVIDLGVILLPFLHSIIFFI